MIKITPAVIGFLLVLPGAAAFGQDIPAVTSVPTGYRGFSLPDVAGSLNFGVTVSETARSGYYGNGGESYSSSISGDAGYSSLSATHPFSMVFAGGYSHVTSQQQSYPYFSLSLSQSLSVRHWSLSVSDAIRDLPESPIDGLSGLPGLGDVGVAPVPTDAQEIFSGFSQRVTNSATVGVQHPITSKMSFNAGGSYSILRFVGHSNGGYEYNQESVQAGTSYRLDPLSRVGVNVSYGQSSYTDSDVAVHSETLSGTYSRQWTRRLNTSFGAGPQRSSRSTYPTASVNLSANALVSYVLRNGSLGITYVRGVQSGSGVVQGALVDSVSASFSRSVKEYGNFSVSGGYANHRQVASLETFSSNSLTASAQASRQIVRNVSGYVSYSIQKQTSQNSFSLINQFSGQSQTVGVGLTYSPHSKQLGH